MIGPPDEPVLMIVEPSVLPPPRWPWSVAFWAPWTITRPWLPRWIRSCDEWHNPSLGIIFPFIGGIVVWRMHYSRGEQAEHLNAWNRLDGWQGICVIDCSFCTEILQDHVEAQAGQ